MSSLVNGATNKLSILLKKIIKKKRFSQVNGAATNWAHVWNMDKCARAYEYESHAPKCLCAPKHVRRTGLFVIVDSCVCFYIIFLFWAYLTGQVHNNVVTCRSFSNLKNATFLIHMYFFLYIIYHETWFVQLTLSSKII